MIEVDGGQISRVRKRENRRPSRHFTLMNLYQDSTQKPLGSLQPPPDRPVEISYGELINFC